MYDTPNCPSPCVSSTFTHVLTGMHRPLHHAFIQSHFGSVLRQRLCKAQGHLTVSFLSMLIFVWDPDVSYLLVS